MRLSRLALQLYSLRRKTRTDPEGTLRQVPGLGYDGVELAGTYGWPIETWKRVLGETGLRVVGAHIGIEALEDDADGHVAFQAALGNGRIIVPSLKHEPLRKAYAEYAHRFNRVAARLRDHEFTFLYHNHAFEFEPLSDGGCGMDVLLAETDPALVRFEFDTFWLERGGQCAAEFLRQHASRTKMIHAKELRKSDDRNVPCGEGDVGFDKVMPMALANGWEIVVEYEADEAAVALQKSAEYLARWIGR